MDYVTWFQPAKIGIKRQCAYCFQIVGLQARALLLQTGARGESCSCRLPQSGRGRKWFSTPRACSIRLRQSAKACFCRSLVYLKYFAVVFKINFKILKIMIYQIFQNFVPSLFIYLYCNSHQWTTVRRPCFESLAIENHFGCATVMHTWQTFA